MCAFRVYTGNRLETLADLLADVLATPPASPLEPEIVVVQSKGMEHWVSLHLARRLGVCANIRFPFPNRFVDDLDRRLTGGDPPGTGFEPDRMRWRILRLLLELMDRPELAHVRGYLSGDERGLRQYQLADRLAYLFDQYLIYRPDMVLRWESETGGDWQAVMWRALVRDGLGSTHRAARARALLRTLESPPPAARLPERIAVFGISALPRFHLDLLAALARSVPVNLFLMNPCREYWGDIASDRDISRAVARAGPGIAEPDLHLEQGHPILASCGMMGRDFFDTIQDHGVEEHEHFTDPGEETLLRAVQSDILHLREPGRSGGRTLRSEDDSIRIHACHSPLREVEVLHDALLERFDRAPGLRPVDVLVTMPDIERYAPFIRAVFDAPDGEGQRIPYTIADRSLRSESELIAAFLGLLELGRERYALSRVLAVLESPSLLRRFGLSEADLETVRAWLAGTGVRWGLDERDRQQRGLPPYPENTWDMGLRRLLLGYAMAGGHDRPFEGVLPFDLLEAGDAHVLEKLLEFTSAVFELLPQLERPAPSAVWSRTLEEILDRFFDPLETAQHEALTLRRALSELQEAAEGRDGQGPVLHLDVVRCFLGQRLEREGLGFGFMTGGVTFCAMLPMRSIPFEVICCLGLDNEAFPRNQRTPDFDLMSRAPRAGDRSRRKDDRYLFLEMVLSARSHLHLSYVGRSQQDNAPLPPSVLVSELLDVVERGFEGFDAPALDGLLLHHPLQAFSPEGFQEEARLRSYSRENLRSARVLLEPPRTPPPFLDRPLPPVDVQEVDLEDLMRFLRNPAAHLLRERLGVVLEAAEGPPEDREPFAVEGLARYKLAERLMARCIDGEDPRRELDRALAEGCLPHGPAGRHLFEELTREVAAFVDGTVPFFSDALLEPVPVDLAAGGLRLTGRLEGVRSSGLCHRRFAGIKARDRVNAWVRHLVLNAAEGIPEAARQTRLIGLSGRRPNPSWSVVRLAPVIHARDLLGDLLALYREGLQAPIPFFPETSWAYVRALARGDTERKALQSALRTWEGNEHLRGDREDPWVQVCFRNRDPIQTEAFRTCASAILGPAVDAETDA